MIYRPILFLILVPFIFWACNGKKTSSLSSKEELHYSFIELKDSLKCDQKTENCAFISLRYPEFDQGPHYEKINGEINKRLEKNLSGYISDTTILSLDALMKQFLREYKEFILEYPQAPHYWYYQAEMSIEHQNSQNISFLLKDDAYTGGAHGMHSSNFFNIDLKKGTVLHLNDIFNQGYEEELSKLLNAKYREEKELQVEDSLNQKGGLLVSNIPPTENFLLRPDEIIFCYNVYEIAPYYFGTIELSIPLEEIKDLLKKKN
ncbi:DUF3298 and DUF4163 domain-containing protein [Xanthovirga aplysinae]|uniref:DUF3298 and DUF4163 domain-containing protein n=1 Tax=Xanthovirga aplysinae TaxID=2529853 RepID=UPI0012BB6D46|nr:DUF3298 and DUF4163 domain-containing protein [Xanthovirga aplysinae]MTI31038.1 DUF3298/DUF4163 domain-containing protein [Xanthovirga aplysinae]